MQGDPAFAAAFALDGNFLGVSVEEITRENMGRYKLSGEPRGVGVRSVIKGSPAERAGIREGDVIVRYDGEQVTSVRKLDRLIEESSPEHAARLTLLRGGSEQEVSATLARGRSFNVAPAAELLQGFDADVLRRRAEELSKNSEQLRKNSEEWRRQGEDLRRRMQEFNSQNPGGAAQLLPRPRRIGVGTSRLSSQLANFFGVSGGVLVNSVADDSPASKAGLRAGDVITEVDGQKVEDGDDLADHIERREGEVTLTVVRDKKSRSVRVTPERKLFGTPAAEPAPFVIAPPVASTLVAPRVLSAPGLLTAPRIQVLPNIQAMPRIRGLVGVPGRVL
jgi:serine protease Do